MPAEKARIPTYLLNSMDFLKNATHDTTRAIDKLITLDPVNFWDFDGSKSDSVNNWYNVIV